jgi:hypothetical protein
MTLEARVRTVEAMEATVCVDAYSHISWRPPDFVLRDLYSCAPEHPEVVFLFGRGSSHRHSAFRLHLPLCASPDEKCQNSNRNQTSNNGTSNCAW